MQHKKPSSTNRAKQAALVIAGLALIPAFHVNAAEADTAETFKQLAGSWKGSGHIKLSDGSHERLTCRGAYSLKGDALSIGIRCASSSYNIDMHSTLNSRGDRVSGHWEERNFSADGTVSGKVSGNHIRLAISGSLNGSMSINVSGSSHSVNISTGGGIGLEGVSIAFSKA